MTCIQQTKEVIDRLATACAQLPEPEGNYLEENPLRVCVLAVVDFQMTETAVIRATKRFDEEAVPAYGLHSLEDLDRFLSQHRDNREAAQLLWRYNLHTRAAMLRGLVRYFLDYRQQSGAASDIEALRDWAQHADFHRDFEGRIKGLGIKAFTMALQRLGVLTVVPDSRVKNFIATQLGVQPGDSCAVRILNSVADQLGMSRTRLDWTIWEFDKRRPQSI